jgi:heptosyltransferase-2
MFSKKLKNLEIKNILVISLSNIGDVILTLPVIDTLKENFPQARLSVIVGPKAADLFSDDKRINMVIYDKHMRLKSKIGFFLYLKRQKFSLIVDLRHSGFSLFLKAPYKTSVFIKVPRTIEHMKYRHLYKLKLTYPTITKFYSSEELPINDSDRREIDEILLENNISLKEKFIIVGPGAASHWKRYRTDGFAKVCDYLIENYQAKIIIVGDKKDKITTEAVLSLMTNRTLNLCGKTNLRQLAYLLKRSKLVISNDSALMHLASYLNIPTLAIFGPTNPKRYGPWSNNSLVVRRELLCSPCESSSCRYNHECMNLLNENELIKQAKKFFDTNFIKQKSCVSTFPVYKRILIIRTDRIGDVLLSTPVIKAIKDFYPNSFIAFMLRPYSREIIEGNPYVDELIIYDKYGQHKGILSSIKFANNLRKKRFDLAVILHPTNRVNLVSFFAAIPQRVGYNRKMGFLLTKKLEDKKYLGEKHELEYSLDVIRALGIEPKDKRLFMPIKQKSELWADHILNRHNLTRADKIVTIHPGASCPSKIWPPERFSQLANRLIEDYQARIFIVAGPKDVELAGRVIDSINKPVVNLAGKTTVSQLASILRRCRLFISNDSGPVHISTAVGTPVISIFGRNQQGLSPRRWGPLGKEDKILHKDVGCIRCLAHDCKKGFTCLKSIKVKDVLELVEELGL